MSNAERIWRSKSDDDLLQAASELDTYNEDGQRIIRAELLRRGLEDPVAQAGETEEAGNEAEPAAPEVDPADPSGFDCLRCDVPLKYGGERKFHEGAHWGALGDLAHLFEKQEAFQVYFCPQCGHVEFFVNVDDLEP